MSEYDDTNRGVFFQPHPDQTLVGSGKLNIDGTESRICVLKEKLSRTGDPVRSVYMRIGVLFEPGARTDWHTHPEGQVLYIASGAGKVQKDDGETVHVSAGDVVYSPAGETHWHGASENSYLMHLSLTTGGPTEWLPRKVTDEEYRSG